MHAYCRNVIVVMAPVHATGQAFVWYVYHLLFVVVARSWAAMSCSRLCGYVVLHALGLAFLRLLMQPIRFRLSLSFDRTYIRALESSSRPIQ